MTRLFPLRIFCVGFVLLVVWVGATTAAGPPCGWSLGYDFSPIGAQPLVLNTNYVQAHITFCGVDAVCSQTFDPHSMACGTYDFGAYDSPNTTWQLVDGAIRLQIAPVSGANGWATVASYYNMVCDQTQAIPTAAPFVGNIDLGPALIIQGYEMRTSLACGSPNQTLIDMAHQLSLPPSNITASSSTGSAASPPSQSSSSSSSAISPFSSSSLAPSQDNSSTCNNPTLPTSTPWYFTYTAFYSSSYFLTFSGMFYTGAFAPGSSSLQFLQVVDIDAWWTVTVDGVVTSRTHVTQLYHDNVNMVNVNTGARFPLEGRSVSVLVNGEVVTLAGALGSAFPIIVNATNTIRAATFAYSQTSIGAACS